MLTIIVPNLPPFLHFFKLINFMCDFLYEMCNACIIRVNTIDDMKMLEKKSEIILGLQRGSKNRGDLLVDI